MMLASSLLVFCGALFIFSAAVGLLRMPDPISRIQTATKATTLGAVLVMAGLALLYPDKTAHYLLLIAFVFLSNPISSHALARAGHQQAHGAQGQKAGEDGSAE